MNPAARVEQSYSKRSRDGSCGPIDYDRGKRRFERGRFRLTALSRFTCHLDVTSQLPSSFASSLKSVIGAVQVRWRHT